jgi:hypothetical protein
MRAVKNSRSEAEEAAEMVPILSGRCFLCNDDADKLCQWCRLVFCCSAEHFRDRFNKTIFI